MPARIKIDDTKNGELLIFYLLLEGAELYSVITPEEDAQYRDGLIQKSGGDSYNDSAQYDVSASLITRLVNQQKVVRHCNTCDLLKLTESPFLLRSIKSQVSALNPPRKLIDTSRLKSMLRLAC